MFAIVLNIARKSGPYERICIYWQRTMTPVRTIHICARPQALSITCWHMHPIPIYIRQRHRNDDDARSVVSHADTCSMRRIRGMHHIAYIMQIATIMHQAVSSVCAYSKLSKYLRCLQPANRRAPVNAPRRTGMQKRPPTCSHDEQACGCGSKT